MVIIVYHNVVIMSAYIMNTGRREHTHTRTHTPCSYVYRSSWHIRDNTILPHRDLSPKPGFCCDWRLLIFMAMTRARCQGRRGGESQYRHKYSEWGLPYSCKWWGAGTAFPSSMISESPALGILFTNFLHWMQRLGLCSWELAPQL